MLREGDIIQLDLLGYHLIAVNSAKVARDLLDKRSGLYSDRPQFVSHRFAGIFPIVILINRG
jgi:hypothetical protein